MPSESCDICGEEADADEIDPHHHFSDPEPDEDEDVLVHLLILGIRKDRTACGADPDEGSDGASTHAESVNCPECRAEM